MSSLDITLQCVYLLLDILEGDQLLFRCVFPVLESSHETMVVQPAQFNVRRAETERRRCMQSLDW